MDASVDELASLRAANAALERANQGLTKQLEAQRAQTHTLRTIIDLLPHRIFWKDRDYRFLGCNRALAHDAQLSSPSEIVGKVDADMPWRDHAPIYRADDIAVVDEGRSKLNYVEPLVGHDGKRMWLRTTKQPLRDEHGELIGLVGFFEDITEQHGVLRSLRASEERYRALVEQAQDGIFLADRRSQITHVNAAGCALLGFRRDELLGKRVEELVDPEDLAQTPLQTAPRSGQRLLTQRKLRHHDGSTIPVEVRSARLPDGTFEAIVRDVRDRAREQAQRRQLEEELRQAQKMESIGRLAGGIAHDFNNLLLVILANAHMLKLRESAPATREIDSIVEASQRASRLTRQLLSFSRKRVLKPDAIDVNALVRGLSDMLVQILGEDVQLSLELAPEDCVILADATQIEQVLMNLVVNARDAISGSGRIALRTARIPGDGNPGEVLLSVEDSGHGMDKTTLARIFEPFFTTKPPGEGTGLGLSMVYGIVTQNGGTISVDSEPGRGSRFELRMPASLPEPPGAARDRSLRSAPSEARKQSACVLLVEDDDAVRSTLEHTLCEAGYRVLAAGGGEDALRIAFADLAAFDLLLSDVVMSSLSGPLIAERLLAERIDLPVLLMSGYSDRLFSQGPLDRRLSFLEKPFTPETLLGRLDELLAQ